MLRVGTKLLARSNENVRASPRTAAAEEDVHSPFRSCTVWLQCGVIAASLGIGVLGYHFLEGLPWIDSLLNASMILGGMGPVDPLKSDCRQTVRFVLRFVFRNIVFGDCQHSHGPGHAPLPAQASLGRGRRRARQVDRILCCGLLAGWDWMHSNNYLLHNVRRCGLRAGRGWVH